MQKVNAVLLLVLIGLVAKPYVMPGTPKAVTPSVKHEPVTAPPAKATASSAAPAAMPEGTDPKEQIMGSMELMQFCDDTAEAIAGDRIDEAFRRISERSVYPAATLTQQQELVKKQLAAIRPRYGKTIGYEFVGVEAPSRSVKCYTYIIKYERHLMRWRFYFYRPAETWILNTFIWDDKVQDL
ncbi:MAG: hypothetical protein ACYTGH_10285 [Planctomycetota bacterium]|jgi:hypothetical protein